MKFFAFLTTLFFGLYTSTAIYAADCVVPNTTTQDSTHIALSELYPAPGDGEEEFIELFNSGSESIMLGGWLLSDESDKQYTIPDGTLLAAGAYIAFYHSTTGITLNNTGDIITLYNATGESRSSTEYDSATSGASWSSIDGTWLWTSATPGEANTEESPTENTTSSETTAGTPEDSDTTDNTTTDQTSPDIQLNELIPNPAGSDTTDEWIEVVNEGSTSVSLHNWQLTDQTTYYTIGSITIQPGEYMVFEVGDTNISLNNTGDTVYLIDPFGTIINGTEYSNAAEGQAWARNGDTWEWTTSSTPSEPNAFTADTGANSESGSTNTGNTAAETQPSKSEASAMTIAEFRALEDNTTATVEGIVTVLPNIFGSQYFYIQDSSAGVQVYSYSKAFPELSEGDRVRVTGSKSTSRNETRIKTSESADITILDHNATVEPVDVTKFEESHEGMLVHIEGEVVERNSSSVTIDDSLSVVIKSTTGISSSVCSVGSRVSIIGVEGQSDDSYRIMPRSTEDITQVAEDTSAWVQPAQAATGKTLTATAAQDPNTNQAVAIAGLLALASAVLGVRYILWHRKQKLAPTATPVPYSDK